MIASRILDRLVARLVAEFAPPPVPLRPLIVDGIEIGYLGEHRAAMLERRPDTFVVAADAIRLAPALDDFASRTAALAEVAAGLASEGALTGWRNERYPVAAYPNGPALFLLERSAARFFGIHTTAAHVNGTTGREGATRMWIARRSPDKAIDPGRLDNLVGGGVASGTSVAATVVKEAWEEAGIPEAVARTAEPFGTVEIRRLEPDGLHWESIHVHDLALPPGFEPANQDGEVADFRLVSVEDAAVLAGNDRGEEVVTADASLVIADWLVRHGHVPQGSPAHASLVRLRRAGAVRGRTSGYQPLSGPDVPNPTR